MVHGHYQTPSHSMMVGRVPRGQGSEITRGALEMSESALYSVDTAQQSPAALGTLALIPSLNHNKLWLQQNTTHFLTPWN